MASPEALEAALNIQFDQDGVDVSASVQQILVAPEYEANEAKPPTGIAVGVCVAVLLLLVVGGVALRCRMRKTSHAQAGSVVMGIPVDGTSPPQVRHGSG